MILQEAQPLQDSLREPQLNLEAAERQAPGQRTEAIEQLERELDDLIDRSGLMPPSNRIVTGLSIPGLSFRTEQGETVRYIVPGYKIELVLAPLGRRLSDIFQQDHRLSRS